MMKLSTVTVAVRILLLSTLFQLVCLVAPGWWIQKTGYTVKYQAMFFFTTCTKGALSKCASKSWLDHFKSEGYDYSYRHIIGVQIFVIIAFVATCFTLGLYMIKRMRPAVLSDMAIVISTCSCMLGSGALMIWFLSGYYIDISLIEGHSATDKLGFPYCILLYSLAVLGNIAVFVVLLMDVRTSQTRPVDQEQELCPLNQ